MLNLVLSHFSLFCFGFVGAWFGVVGAVRRREISIGTVTNASGLRALTGGAEETERGRGNMKFHETYGFVGNIRMKSPKKSHRPTFGL